MTLYYPRFPEGSLCRLLVGAHHGLVHRLSVSHPGVIPGLLCGKRVERGVWDLRWCTLVGSGKQKVKKKIKEHLLGIRWSINIQLHFIITSVTGGSFLDYPDHDWVWWQGSQNLEWAHAGSRFQHDWGGLLCTSGCKYKCLCSLLCCSHEINARVKKNKTNKQKVGLTASTVPQLHTEGYKKISARSRMVFFWPSLWVWGQRHTVLWFWHLIKANFFWMCIWVYLSYPQMLLSIVFTNIQLNQRADFIQLDRPCTMTM